MLNLTKTGKPRDISQDMILDSTSLTRSSTESTNKYLKKLTHVHLQNKRIKNIEGLKICPNLKVIYLYDNQIENIETVNELLYLEYIQLQGNMIRVIPDIKLIKLQKLFLNHNEISFISGLEACQNLEELHVSTQSLPDNQPLQFDPISLNAISSSLLVLDCSGNNINILEPFKVLIHLQRLGMSRNNITDLNEIIDLFTLPLHLIEANFIDNPCTKTYNYRNHIISSSLPCLEMLDEKPVTSENHTNITGFMTHKDKLHAVNKREITKGDIRQSDNSMLNDFTLRGHY